MPETRVLTEGEIERLARSQAEREAFVKSTTAFVLVWLAGFLAFLFVPDHHYRFLGCIVSLRLGCFLGSFLVAFVAGLVTHFMVRDSAYEKYYTLYKEQMKQEQADSLNISFFLAEFGPREPQNYTLSMQKNTRLFAIVSSLGRLPFRSHG